MADPSKPPLRRLQADIVVEVFEACRFKVGEDAGTPLRIRGIVHEAHFHADRLEAQRAQIAAWLAELPTEFRQTAGGGWTFLNFCTTNVGEQWTGMHMTGEMLFCMGVGLRLARILDGLPADMLPGGMPFVVIERAAYDAPLPKDPS